MAFHEVRLPEDVERGAQGGPGFNTTVITLSSGFERRNINWEQARQRWDIGYGLMDREGNVDQADFSEVLAFFYAREGRAHGFRFKDWTDFELARQLIGTTDGGTTTQFQVFKRYTSGVVTYDRPLTKIVSGSVSVWVNSVSIAEGAGASQYQINLNTGIITLGSTLAAQSGTDVEVECEFDIPVRFDVDQMEMNAVLYNAASVPAIPVVEIRVDENGEG